MLRKDRIQPLSQRCWYSAVPETESVRESVVAVGREGIGAVSGVAVAVSRARWKVCGKKGVTEESVRHEFSIPASGVKCGRGAGLSLGVVLLLLCALT